MHLCSGTIDNHASVFVLQLADDEKFLELDFGGISMQLHAVDVLALSILGDVVRRAYSESHYFVKSLILMLTCHCVQA